MYSDWSSNFAFRPSLYYQSVLLSSPKARDCRIECPGEIMWQTPFKMEVIDFYSDRSKTFYGPSGP
jgi:hypothetical protein